MLIIFVLIMLTKIHLDGIEKFLWGHWLCDQINDFNVFILVNKLLVKYQFERKSNPNPRLFSFHCQDTESASFIKTMAVFYSIVFNVFVNKRGWT
jgi:hypothetical protein